MCNDKFGSLKRNDFDVGSVGHCYSDLEPYDCVTGGNKRLENDAEDTVREISITKGII
jgi:hypothetical protein